jgi:cold shock protein
MASGMVKWFDSRKGFGFIFNGDSGDVFVHYKVIAGDGFRFLKIGEEVEYEAADGANGRYAVSVRQSEKAVKKRMALCV